MTNPGPAHNVDSSPGRAVFLGLPRRAWRDSWGRTTGNSRTPLTEFSISAQLVWQSCRHTVSRLRHRTGLRDDRVSHADGVRSRLHQRGQAPWRHMPSSEFPRPACGIIVGARSSEASQRSRPFAADQPRCLVIWTGRFGRDASYRSCSLETLMISAGVAQSPSASLHQCWFGLVLMVSRVPLLGQENGVKDLAGRIR